MAHMDGIVIRDPHHIADVYRAAATLLETRGWARGTNLGVNGNMCITGAINSAAGRSLWLQSDDLLVHFARWIVNNRAADLIRAYTLVGFDVEHDEDVRRVLRGDFTTEDVEGRRLSPATVIQTWNDANVARQSRQAARTQEEVIAALRMCADDLGAGGVRPVGAGS